jgi:membrane peptidoglycan carboxypeptidase
VWKKHGYPFDSLVPSYATAIGSSADRPSSLAELVGIIQNGGVRYPVVRIDELHFASGTPYETLLQRKESEGERVLAPEIASVARSALIDVAEKGTAEQIRGAFVRSDGTPVAVGGKTGTGDNRHNVFGRHGQLVESRVLNRAAVFVFFIGDRFFGAITTYVPGPAAAGYAFTSSLPVRILKTMAPTLMPMIEVAEPNTAMPHNGTNSKRLTGKVS